MDDALPEIQRDVWLPAETGTVWRHLSDGRLLSTWFAAEVELTVRPGGRITLDPGEGQPLRWGTVEEVVPEHTIQWAWRTDEGEPSLVRIILEPTDGGTRLTVTERLLAYEMHFYPRIAPGTWLPQVDVA